MSPLHLCLIFSALLFCIGLAGALAGLEPWEVFCGNGWIVRRRWPGPVPQFDREAIGAVVREELTSAGVLKGVR